MILSLVFFEYSDLAGLDETILKMGLPRLGRN
jgi:hypothetical protein